MHLCSQGAAKLLVVKFGDMKKNPGLKPGPHSSGADWAVWQNSFSDLMHVVHGGTGGRIFFSNFYFGQLVILQSFDLQMTHSTSLESSKSMTPSKHTLGL